MDTRTEHLHRAFVALYRAGECERIGPVKFSFIDDAAAELAEAGEIDLAARVSRSAGGNIAELQEAVGRLR